MSEDLTGSRIQRFLKRAVERVRSSAEELDRINVFPVADGDTGHNVLTTLEGALAALNAEQGNTIGLAWHLAASGALDSLFAPSKTAMYARFCYPDGSHAKV